MLKTIRKIFAPPIFEDTDKTRAAQYLNAILNVSIIAPLFMILSGAFSLIINIVFFIILVAFIGIRFLMHSGRVDLSSFLYISIAWLSMTYLAFIGNGVRDPAVIAYVLFVLLASLLGHIRLSITLTIINIAALWMLSYTESKGILIPTPDSVGATTLSISVVFLIITTAIYYTVTNLTNSLDTLKENENKLINRNKKLLQLQDDLEKQVIETEKTSVEAETRAIRLQTIAKVSQRIALNQNLETLLPEIAKRISEDFEFYHVGIFMISQDGKFAELQTSNSPGGKKMLERGHQLALGQVGIVGRTAKDGRPRVALDVGQDAAYFDNPDLPDTHSEMALPLKLRTEIIGVLDVQSKRKAAFSQEDTDIFEILANQIAIAIENARHTEETRAALEESQSISRQYIHQAWTQLTATQRQQGYRYAEKRISPLPVEENIPEDKEDILTFPVQVREETIGFLEIRKDESSQSLTEEELELVQAIANRAALALENARLLEESTRRAGRERLVSNITTKIRSSNDPQVMIQTALDELKNALGASKVELAKKKSKSD